MRGKFPPENHDDCLPWLLPPYFFYVADSPDISYMSDNQTFSSYCRHCSNYSDILCISDFLHLSDFLNILAKLIHFRYFPHFLPHIFQKPPSLSSFLKCVFSKRKKGLKEYLWLVVGWYDHSDGYQPRKKSFHTPPSFQPQVLCV